FGGACSGATTFLSESIAGVRDDIIAGDLMPGLQQVRRHRRAHIAEADKADRRHASPPLWVCVRRDVSPKCQFLDKSSGNARARREIACQSKRSSESPSGAK